MPAPKYTYIFFRILENHTYENYLDAIREDGRNLFFVKKQTPELCLEAVNRDSTAIIYVKEKTPEIWAVVHAKNF